MKTPKLLLLIMTLCTLAFFTESCEDESCPSINCNTGTLNEDTCVCDCPDGFSGDNCEIEDVCFTQNIDCGFGDCDAGMCNCQEGYAQDANGSCTVEWSAKFLGSNLSVQDSCYGQNGNFDLSYNMSIERIDEKKINTTNLGGFGATNSVQIDVVAENDLVINFADIAGREFSGTGTINNDIITIDYIVLYSDNTRDTCQAVIMK